MTAAHVPATFSMGLWRAQIESKWKPKTLRVASESSRIEETIILAFMNDDTSEVVRLLREIRDLLAGAPPASGAEHGRPIRKRVTGPRVKEARAETDDSPLIEQLLSKRSTSAKWEPVWERGRSLDRLLAVLAVAEEELGAEAALSAPDVARLLDERFRIAGVHATNVNRDFKKARAYVRRVRAGNSYKHTLNRKGITYINRRLEDLSREPVA